ncbi:MAG: TIGR02117 family protein [Bacteroidota bacterium]|nr:TIGR02117 family protein [Bacteroidota bacterium]
MIKLFKILWKLIITFIGLILLYLLFAYLLSRITISKEKTYTKPEVVIHIKTNGVHTDIVMPTKNEYIDWSKQLKFADTKIPDTTQTYLGLGWGDKGFYLETPTWAELKPKVAFNATFGLGTTAIHATYYSEMIENESCKKILLTKEQYLRLIAFISKSFKKDKNGNFINIKTNANYGNTDAFYEANGTYSLFYTCNTWANSALKNCGQTCCLWTVHDKAIFKKYK